MKKSNILKINPYVGVVIAGEFVKLYEPSGRSGYLVTPLDDSTVAFAEQIGLVASGHHDKTTYIVRVDVVHVLKVIKR